MEESEAFAILKQNNISVSSSGLILLPYSPWLQLPKELREAIIYLCDEWDYDTILESEVTVNKL